MKVDTFACDNCQKQRADDSNRWFQIWEHTDKDGLSICKFDDQRAFGHMDCCGQECVTAMLTRYLATGSFSRTPAGFIR